MNLYLAEDNQLIENLSKIIVDNLSNENFGVNEFILASGLNRNYLNSRLKAIRQVAVSKFITEVRLEKAREFLLEGTYTAAEVSYNVGFSSPSYFNRCFHDHFGYPPGDIKKRTVSKPESTVSEAEIVAVSNPKTDPKNVKYLYRIAAVVGLAGIIFIFLFFIRNSLAFQRASKEKSIAVLPFKNLSEKEETRYFADGVVEDILDRLTKIKELRVVSRTSVEQFRETTQSAPEIGKELGVNYLLEGSVQRQEGKVRITIQLIDTKNDRHILSERIDRPMEDILELESDIAKLVADKLQAAISPSETQLIEKKYTSNTKAYDYYLMGRYYWNLNSFTSFQKSLGYFEKAIKADSTYALAYAGLADVNYCLSGYNDMFRQTPAESYDKACKQAKKALQIDANLPEAYAILGIVNSTGYWQWEQSRKYFEKAMDIDSNNIVTLYYYSRYLNITGDFETSRKYFNRALEFAPYSIRFRRLSSYQYYRENKPKEALQEILLVKDMLGDQFDEPTYLFWCYINAGDTISALHVMQNTFETNPSFKNFKAHANQVFPVYKSSGLTGLYRMMFKNPPDYWYSVQMDSIDAAIRYLERAFKNQKSNMDYLLLSRDFERLHDEPRFQQIIDQVHLRPYFNKRYKK